ncbi:hypothetical protein DFAR_20004 [Desulfarculales bacterium]
MGGGGRDGGSQAGGDTHGRIRPKPERGSGGAGAQDRRPARGVLGMASTLLINARSYETRVALVENGQVVEVYVERHKQGALAGNIYAGRVARVLPGMQAAFVDIGLTKAAFLYVSDVRRSSTPANWCPARPSPASGLRGSAATHRVPLARGRRSWCRWPRSHWATRAPALPATSPCRGAIWSSCPPSTMWASAGASRRSWSGRVCVH